MCLFFFSFKLVNKGLILSFCIIFQDLSRYLLNNFLFSSDSCFLQPAFSFTSLLSRYPPVSTSLITLCVLIAMPSLYFCLSICSLSQCGSLAYFCDYFGFPMVCFGLCVLCISAIRWLLLLQSAFLSVTPNSSNPDTGCL